MLFLKLYMHRGSVGMSVLEAASKVLKVFLRR